MNKRLAALIAGLALLAAACGSGHAVSLGPAPSGPASATSPPVAGTGPSPSAPAASHAPSGASGQSPGTSPARTISVQVWLIRSGKLFVTGRTEPYTLAVGQAALAALLRGPSAAERAAGLRSAIPAGTRLHSLRIAAGTATVNLSSGFESGATPAVMPSRLAQVVYTATQFPAVTSVRFDINGQGRTVVGGVPVQGGQTRAAYSSYLSPITVTAPVIGQQISSPVSVSGTADVFEATVSLRILDAAGHEIARTFTTASCGTGCRGSFSVPVGYTVSSAQPGIVEVFESSPKDGSPRYVQSIPVTLLP